MMGYLSEYEEREAARFGLIPWHVWRRLPRDERVRGVAYYRLNHLIGLHESEVMAEHYEANSHKGGGR